MHFLSLNKIQKGASLIEVIAYLGVAGLIIGGALAMYSSATGAQSSNQLTAEIAGTRTSIKSLYATSAYGGVSLTNVLKYAGRLPSTWTANTVANTAVSETGGLVTILGATSTFTVTLDTLSTAQCASILARQISQGWSAVSVDGGSAAPGTATIAGTSITSSTATAATVAAACSTTATSGYNKISLTN